MSSPAPSDAGEQDNKKKGVVTFRFCSECSNMLYPKEDEIHRRLMFECRTCAYTEEAASTRVFQHNMTSTSDENADVTPDVGSDPTLPRTNKACPNDKCDSNEAVFFQAMERTAETGMKLFFVCCECGTKFT
ncbi:hypothetical protein GE09DRAFT_978822 [Coniochaeta sp. 2T2.1]|nr:hypothetical protein GE09DRAFT_978822 [Coniochaeta sp. 2T2.1]